MSVANELPAQPECESAPGYPPLPSDPREARSLPLSWLVIDPRIQRDPAKQDATERLAVSWNWALAEAITVVRQKRDFSKAHDLFRVVEGQGRYLALLRRAGDNAKNVRVWCMVLPDEYLGRETEAAIGLEISTGRRPHDALDKFQMRVTMGEAHEVAATHVLDACGLRIGKTASSRTIASAAAVSRIIHGRSNTAAQGAALLNRTIAVLMAAWPEPCEDVASRFDHRLMGVVADLLARNPDLEDRRLVATLRAKMPTRWLTDPVQNSAATSVRAAAGAALAAAYNKGLRSGQVQW